MNSEIYYLVEHLRGCVLEMTYVLAAAARHLSQITGGEVVAVLLSQEEPESVKDLPADRVLCVEHPQLAEFTSEAYLQVLAALIKDNPPRAFLLGHTSIGMDLASGLSARLGIPVVSQCKSFTAAEDRPVFISQIYGGRILVEGRLPYPTALVTMIPGGYKPEPGSYQPAASVTKLTGVTIAAPRVNLVQYIEPEITDIDLTKEEILVAVGRGLQNQTDLELVEEFARALHGVVCASRPIVDLGWLPTTRLVGKSGKSVKPKLYLALGISGAPEHVEGITNSEMIIAINTDPNAPIFGIARYGGVVDMYAFMEAAIKQMQGIGAG